MISLRKRLDWLESREPDPPSVRMAYLLRLFRLPLPTDTPADVRAELVEMFDRARSMEHVAEGTEALCAFARRIEQCHDLFEDKSRVIS